MPRLLVVHHTSSPALRAMLEAAVAGARDPELAEAGIDVVVSPALAATVPDVLAADAFVLGTPANIGYMSGALKHFFDQIYYPCLDAKAGAPYGLYVHGASDTTGAVRAVKSIASGLGWAEVVNPVVAIGPVGKDVERQCYELGATVAANLAGLSRVIPGLLRRRAHHLGRVVAEVVQQHDGGVPARRAGDGAAGVRGRAGLVQAGDRHPVRRPARRRAQRP